MMAAAFQGRRVTLTVAAVMFMLLLDTTILNTSLPAIAASLHVQPLALTAVLTVYILAGAAVLPLAPWVADRFGLKQVFVAAIALFSAASLLCGLAGTPLQLVMARALQGLASGLMLPSGRTLAIRGARKDELLGITALLTWPVLFAPVLGPPLGALVTTYASWRWNFFLNIPIGLVAMALVVRWVPGDGRVSQAPFDWAGSAGAALGLMALISGLELASQAIGDVADRMPALLCCMVGLASLAWTVRHLRRAPAPILSLSPFRDHTFKVATVGGTVASMAIQASPFLLPLLFQVGMGKDAVAAGAMLVPYFLGNLGMKAVTTPILRRFGFRRVTVVSGACSTAALLALATVGPETPWNLLVLVLVAAGCARSMQMTAITTLMYADLPPAQIGAGSALAAISTQVASALGIATAALAVAVAGRLHAHAHAGLQDFHGAFLAIAAISALGVLQFLRLPPNAGAQVIQRA